MTLYDYGRRAFSGNATPIKVNKRDFDKILDGLQIIEKMTGEPENEVYVLLDYGHAIEIPKMGYRFEWRG